MSDACEWRGDSKDICPFPPTGWVEYDDGTRERLCIFHRVLVTLSTLAMQKDFSRGLAVSLEVARIMAEAGKLPSSHPDLAAGGRLCVELEAALALACAPKATPAPAPARRAPPPGRRRRRSR